MAFPVVTIMAGNTHTKCVSWHADGRVGEFVRWATHDATLYHEDVKLRRAASPSLYSALEKLANASTKIVLAGVTPSYQDELKLWLDASGYTVLRFRTDVPAPITIVPQPAEKVGDDRIAVALGALAVNPKSPAVVIDSGTALTVNAVFPGRFEGGVILPGQDLMLGALKAFTQRLPRLEHIPLPATLDDATAIGRNTDEAMTRGAWHAYVAGAISAATAQHRVLGKHARVLLTGGGAGELLPHLAEAFSDSTPVELHPHLVHEGLFAAFRAHQK